MLQSIDVLEYWDCVWNFYLSHNPLLLEYLSTLLAAESKFTYVLTSGSRVLLEKLTDFQIIKKFPAFIWVCIPYNCRMISEQWYGKDAQGSGLNTASLIEKRIQTHDKFHGLIFPPTTYIYHLPLVRVSVGNNILHLSGMLDFEGTETLWNHILKVLLHFSFDSFLTYVPTMKILPIKQYFISKHTIIVGYTLPHSSATFRRINWTCVLGRQMIHCKRQSNDNIGGVSVTQRPFYQACSIGNFETRTCNSNYWFVHQVWSMSESLKEVASNTHS